jgi:hypothetical protein
MAGDEVVEQTKAAIEAARKSVQAACDLLTGALSQLTPLLPDAKGPLVRDTVTSYIDARATLTTQLAVLDRALAAMAD